MSANPDLDAIDQLLERAEVYLLAVIREGIGGSGNVAGSGQDRTPTTIAARRRLVETVVKLAQEGRLG